METVKICFFNEPNFPERFICYWSVDVDPKNKELMKFLCFELNKDSTDISAQTGDKDYEAKKIKVELELDHDYILSNIGIDPRKLYEVLTSGGEVSFEFDGKFSLRYRMPRHCR